MFKFAYLINMPGYTPETYGTEYTNSESFSIVAGVDGVDGAKECARKLAGEGFDLINLCSEFDDQAISDIGASAENAIRIQNVSYYPEELSKLESSSELMNYGVIIQMAGVDESCRFDLKSPDCNTTAYFVKDMDQAKDAAKAMVGEGIHFIELCGWFKDEQTREIIAAVDGKIPVGSCGI